MTEIDLRTLELKRVRSYAELLVTAFGWALSTILIKMYIGTVPPLHLLMGRFVIGVLFVFALQPKNIARIKKQDLKIGIPLGFLVFGAYSFGLICLKYTSASKSGFLVSLSVLFIPLIHTIIKKQAPSKWTIISVGMSLVGMSLISGINGDGFNFGDLLAIGSSIIYTVYILALDRYGKDIEDTLLTLIQLGVVAICSILAVVLIEGFSMEYIRMAWIPIMVIGVLCTGLATLCQTRAQKVASPESVGLLFLGEPLFTLIMAHFILGETIFFSGVIGGILILVSLVIAVLKKI